MTTTTWGIAIAVAAAVIIGLNELLGRPVPFLRWSFIRIALGSRTFTERWQVGDGREDAVLKFVMEKAPRGDLDAAIRAIDEFGYRKAFLMNVGDRKGAIVEAALARVKPLRVLELGAYVGYSALRIARALPEGGSMISVEWSPANAVIARRMIEHAGVADRVTIVVGSLGDDGKTIASLRDEHGLGPRSVDFVFIDHAKDEYLPDLRRILEAGWLHEGSVVVADNVGFPGAPAYRSYMEAEDGKRWRTRFHATRVEYQSVIPDLVLESTLLSPGGETAPSTSRGSPATL